MVKFLENLTVRMIFTLKDWSNFKTSNYKESVWKNFDFRKTLISLKTSGSVQKGEQNKVVYK